MAAGGRARPHLVSPPSAAGSTADRGGPVRPFRRSFVWDSATSERRLPGPPDTLPALANPTDAAAPLTDRARAWLHTNCAQCHRPGGPTPSSLDLRATTALAALNACDALPQAGDLGISDSRLSAPGDAARSVLLARVNSRDANGMPPVGSSEIDSSGVTLLTDWINSLAGCL